MRTAWYLTVHRVVDVIVFPRYKVRNSVAFEVSVVIFDPAFREHLIDYVGHGVGELAVEACLLIVVFVPGDETAKGPGDVVLSHDEQL